MQDDQHKWVRYFIGATTKLLFLCGSAFPSWADLATLNCSAFYQINQLDPQSAVPRFKNGSGWSFCWAPASGYGYTVTQVRYTSPQFKTTQILETMHVAQMFVPYDNNAARYHDISWGRKLSVLKSVDCPQGILSSDTKLCITVENRGLSFRPDTKTSTLPALGERLRIFGYYGIGSYYYTFQFVFNDDGSIEPSMGASGSLQWFSTDSTTGSSVAPVTDSKPYGVNHHHFVIWRLHFSIDDGRAGTSIPPMVVEQVDFNQTSAGGPLEQSKKALATETSVKNNLATQRYWQVSNTDVGVTFALDQSVATQYRSDLYFSDVDNENFTLNDFYLSQYQSSEVLVDGGLTSSYVTSENVTDPVVWYGVNFHHVPREEDVGRMPQHWQGFKIRPIFLP